MVVSILPVVKALAEVLFCILLFFVPVSIVFAFIARSKRAYETAAKEPFTDLPLRPPGESTRLQADALFEKAMESYFALVVASAILGLVVALTPNPQRIPAAVVAGSMIVAFAAFAGIRVQRLLRTCWDYRLGFKGERLVGEELNQLLAVGYSVYHDVPFDVFNIDHIAVGPAGVFVVETKTRRKRKTKGAQPAHVVYFDGKALKWPTGRIDLKSVEQAERNGRTVADWLGKATGTPVRCQPILTIPGWWVESTLSKPAEVIVRSSKGLHRFLPGLAVGPLSADRVKSIAYVIAERCRSASE